MKMTKFAPIVGIIVVLVLAGTSFGQADADKAAEAAKDAGLKYTDGGGATEGAAKEAVKTVTGAATAEGDKKDAPEGDKKEGTEEGKDGESEKKDPGFLGQPWFLPVMIGGFVLLWLFMGRGRKKQQAKRRDMLSTLKKGDRVMTIGGVIGTVAEAREQELVVKVDDGTRIKFARWAIRNAGEDVATEKQKDEQSEK
ncbi:MAG: preprotein translocase subunit YajC [Phycisphaerae bacterium]|nr:preprotein translocase subunit YajC [Phycisphaerae bacterium]